MSETATCRGCGRAYHPAGEETKQCYYGGFVCSERCDRKACLELEQSMPGHGITQTRLGQDAELSMGKWKPTC